MSQESLLKGAEFRYHPEELFGLAFALQNIAEAENGG